MAKRGRKRKSDALKIIKGTFQRARARRPVVAPLAGELVAPKWLRGLARKLWNEKTAIYARRGQSVIGCEGALAQYVCLEADLIERWKSKRREEIPTALVNAHRIYANEFYDTPSSQQGAIAGTPRDNPFARNGRRPTSSSA